MPLPKLGADSIYVLCVCVCSLSVHWLPLTFLTLLLCQKKQEQAPPSRRERDICKYGETCFCFSLSSPSSLPPSLPLSISPCSLVYTDDHACVCMFYSCVNVSICVSQQGTLRHPKLNSMSKSDTRLHEINRFPCNGNCK